ncbi:MAG: glycosyltransferase family 2 protein [Candidatus Eiseniibacteriota bacterium]|jgi:glycosyltransferase involved in cell wall biosynthesis
MYRGQTVTVVIPAHDEERLIGGVIETVPSFVDRIVVVDDASTDRTVDIVREHASADPERVVLIQLPVNQGVGGAVAAGYAHARDQASDLTVVMAGDAQMDPDDMPRLLDPIVDGAADYTKGNRLLHGEAWRMIPRIRYLGNSGLSLLTKVASGYWHIADSQTGYTAASLAVLRTLVLGEIYKRYGMPNDLLVKLNIDDFRVADVHVHPVYNVGERSGLRIGKVFFTIPLLLARLFLQRLVRKYVIRDFHPLVLFYALGILLLFADVGFAVRLLVLWARDGHVPPITALAVLFCTVTGLQSLLFAMLFDMQANQHLKVPTVVDRTGHGTSATEAAAAGGDAGRSPTT